MSARSQPTRSKQGAVTMPFIHGGGVHTAVFFPLLMRVAVQSA